MKFALLAAVCIFIYCQQIHAEVYTGAAYPVPLLGSCKQIQTNFPAAISGDYNIQTQSGANVRVYCEMVLNGGGYTFFHPTAFYQITPADVTAMVTDKASAILLTLHTGGYQKYSLLQQLSQYSSKPISITMNGDPAYKMPVNSGLQVAPFPAAGYMGTPFFQVEFLSIADSTNNNLQGVQINGKPVTFTNCDTNPNGRFAVFPNNAEKAANPSGNLNGIFYQAIVNATVPTSARNLPVDYYRFLEWQFGGCGDFFQSTAVEPIIRGGVLGFR